MAYELKEGQGSLFPNKRKETESHPNLTGTILVGGVEHWISGWVKLTAEGVRQIRKMDGSIPRKEIAAMFNIDTSNVGLICRRKAWAHVDN